MVGAVEDPELSRRAALCWFCKECAACSDQKSERCEKKESPGTALRFRPPPLHYVQLLPADALARQRARAQRFPEDSERSAGPVRLRFVRLRRYARTDPSAHQRASHRESVSGHEGAQTARLPRVAATQNACFRRTVAFVGRAARSALGALLAAPVLRFQRVERAQEEREDELHALQPRQTRPGSRSGRLDLEQLPILLEG